MPPKSMSVIFILFTKGYILGILGCADGEVCSFRLLRVPAYKVPATCKVGAFYFFIKAVSVITVLVQKGAGKQNTVYPQYTVKFMQLFTLTQWATSGASWLVCCGSDLFRQKNFYFLCFAPLQEPENFGSPCSADGARRKRFSGTRRRSILPKFSEPRKGKQKIKLFWKRTGGRVPERKRRAEVVQKKCKKTGIFPICRRTAETRKTALQQDFLP